MKEMKTISFNGQQYEIVDAKAREDINQKWKQIVLTPPTSNVTDDYLATLIDENWIGFWQGSVYINYKYISGSLTFYYQHHLSFGTLEFKANSRYGIKHYEGDDISWYGWTSTQNNSVPYRRQTFNAFRTFFKQLEITSNSSADNSGYQISTAFVKVEVPQTDETTGAELPIGDYFMVGDIANDQIGCWSLTDNQSYTITRTKDESEVWHYSVTSSKTVLEEKADKSYVDELFTTDEDVKNIIIENTDNELNNISNNPISNSAVENALHTTYDTDVVEILFNTDYVEATADGAKCCYIVKNGICYVNLDFIPKTTLSSQETFAIFIPIPKIPMCIECTPFNMEEYTRTGVINVTKIELEDGTLGGFYGVSLMEGCRYMCSFSYPVEY